MDAQYGAAMTVATSMTRRPESGRSPESGSFISDNPLLSQLGDFGTRELEQLAHHFVRRVAQRRPKVGDPPGRLGQRGHDVGDDDLANPVRFHFGEIATRLEMLVREDVG